MNKLFAFLLICTSMFGFSQTKQDYIYTYAKIAVDEMESSRIPASITLAQGILESRYGTSELSSKSNNHFGIKCHKGWKGKSVKYDDDAKDECFRKYESPAQSFSDHSAFLSTRGRYSDLFKLSIYDYKGWAKGLRKAGYATNPKYADHLIRIIEEEQLYVFDRMASHEVEPYIASLRNNVKPNEVFVVKVEEKQVNKPVSKTTLPPVQTVSVQEKVITVQGGPAAAPEDDMAQSRDIFSENDVKTVFSFNQDTPAKLSAMYNVPIERLYKYNEWPEYLNEFTWGMKVYLQPKRSKSRDISQLYHKVKSGETMYQIGQHYGIKTEKLYKWNLMNEAKREQPRAGEMISLRKKVRVKPLLRRPQDTFTVEQMPQQNQDEAVEITSEPKESQPTQPKPVVSPQKPAVIKPVSQQPKPVQNPQTKPQNSQSQTSTEDPWATYPSTRTEEQRKATQQPATPPASKTQQQVGGRSVIYDSTPAVNQQPVRAYEPPKTTRTQPRTSTSTSSTVLNPKPTSQPKPAQPTYHNVVKGDTLYGLSKKYGVSVTQIKTWNNMSGNTIKLGQRLIVGK